MQPHHPPCVAPRYVLGEEWRGSPLRTRALYLTALSEYLEQGGACPAVRGLLEVVVKLDPGLHAAWTCLGHCYCLQRCYCLRCCYCLRRCYCLGRCYCLRRCYCLGL